MRRGRHSSGDARPALRAPLRAPLLGVRRGTTGAFEPAAAGAIAGIEALTRTATGSVTFGMYRGTLHVESMSASTHGLYREEDASMEASDGLNPTSAQGFLDIAGVSARTLAAAGQIHPNPWER